MTYIFMDESGDMGFSDKSSKWFLFTLVVVEDVRKIEKIIKKARNGLKKKYKRDYSELHAYNCDDITRAKILSKIADLNVVIMTTILNKKKVHVDLHNQKNYLYTYTANIILNRLIDTKIINTEQQISLVVDRKDTKKNLRENFISQITNAMHKHKHKKFSIELSASHNEKGLQVVDFISWAIFRKYERGDFEFYEIIRSKIIDEKLLFP